MIIIYMFTKKYLTSFAKYDKLLCSIVYIIPFGMITI